MGSYFWKHFFHLIKALTDSLDISVLLLTFFRIGSKVQVFKIFHLRLIIMGKGEGVVFSFTGWGEIDKFCSFCTVDPKELLDPIRKQIYHGFRFEIESSLIGFSAAPHLSPCSNLSRSSLFVLLFCGLINHTILLSFCPKWLLLLHISTLALPVLIGPPI